MIVNVIVLIILILVNAFFAASEMAFVSLNDNKINLLAESGDKRAGILNRMLKEPTRFLSTIQIGITLGGFLNAALAADSFSVPIVDAMKLFLPFPETVLKTIAVVLIQIVLAFVQIVFGELVPKRLAMRNAEKFSFLIVGVMNALSKVAYPFVKLLTVATNLTLRLFRIDPNEVDSEISEEEIRMMVDVGQEKGGISSSERDMINNIFDFDNTTVAEVMRHRTDILAIQYDITLDELTKIMEDVKYSRFPVIDESIDNVVGVLYIKDLIRYLSHNDRSSFSMKKIMREAMLIPDSKRADTLFYEFQKNKVHFAIVIDEYGGTAGLVTMEDLIEEIVGEVFDEYDSEELPDIKVVTENEFILPGSMDLDEVTDLLDIDFPVDNYNTLNGFMVNKLGFIPGKENHSELEYNGYLFTILKADNRVINEVKVKKID